MNLSFRVCNRYATIRWRWPVLWVIKEVAVLERSLTRLSVSFPHCRSSIQQKRVSTGALPPYARSTPRTRPYAPLNLAASRVVRGHSTCGHIPGSFLSPIWLSVEQSPPYPASRFHLFSEQGQSAAKFTSAFFLRDVKRLRHNE
jgi:hypothetical protein